jgi:site-specific DNA-methyltransferase (adenine-specific)
VVKAFYADDRVKLYRADALDLLRSLDAASVSLIFADPPYKGVKNLWWDNQWKSDADFLAWIGALCDGFKRVLAPNGSFYVCASPAMAWAVEGQVRQRFNVLNSIRWYKDAGWHKKARPEDLRSYLEPWESIIFAEQWWADASAEGEAGYYSQCKALHKNVYAPIGRYIQQERERAALSRNDVEVALGYVSGNDPTRGTALCYRWEEGSSLPTKDAYERLRVYLNTHGNGCGEYLRESYEYLRESYEDLRAEYESLRRPFTLTKDRPSTDLWTYESVQPDDEKHPTEKPLEMLLDIVKTSSRPMDLVVDPFLGRGATAVAAQGLGRRFVGGDIQEHWVSATVSRLKEARGEMHMRVRRRDEPQKQAGQIDLFEILERGLE